MFFFVQRQKYHLSGPFADFFESCKAGFSYQLFNLFLFPSPGSGTGQPHQILILSVQNTGRRGGCFLFLSRQASPAGIDLALDHIIP